MDELPTTAAGERDFSRIALNGEATPTDTTYLYIEQSPGGRWLRINLEPEWTHTLSQQGVVTTGLHGDSHHNLYLTLEVLDGHGSPILLLPNIASCFSSRAALHQHLGEGTWAPVEESIEDSAILNPAMPATYS